MAVYKIFPAADATIYSAYPAKNTGRDEVIEVSVKNSQDGLRYINRSLLTQSPYYSYDLAANDNYTTTGEIFPSSDIRRSLIQFSDQDLQILRTFASQSVSGSWDAYLKLSLAFAQNLSNPYTIEAYAVSQSWTMGTGKYATVPEIRNGVCWNNVGGYNITPIWKSAIFPNFYWETATATWENFTDYWDWLPPFWSASLVTSWEDATPVWEWDPTSGFVSGGGSWNAGLASSQSFDYMSNKDINMKVTDIADAWFNGQWPNYGIILKHKQDLEDDQNTFIDLKYFSVDTHTIYPPCIELRWDDSHYYPVGGRYVLNDQITITLANNPGQFKKDAVHKFRTSTRYTYPTRQFTTSSVYLSSLYLSQESYWAHNPTPSCAL